MYKLPLAVVLAAALALGFAPADAGLENVAPVPAKTVGQDPLGDWGGGGDAALAGHALGQDLLSASIGLPKADTLRFVLGVSFLPASGGVPEVTRYTWNFLVGGKAFELDGKFTNYSRGACDATSGQCPPPRDPGQTPFLLRGNCSTNEGNVTLCQELALLRAVFTPSARTITVDVPTALLAAQPCTVVAGGTNLFGGSVSAAPSAYFTTSRMPMDTMFVDESFRIPSADPVNKPCTT